MFPGVIRKVGVRFAAVHGEFAGTGAQKNAGDGFFAASGPMEPSFAACSGATVVLNDPPRKPARSRDAGC